MELTPYLTFFITMAAIINPLGDLAIFISLMAGHPIKDQRKAAIQAGSTVGIVLLLSIWGGTWILKVFGINAFSFEAGGGVVLFLIGITMVNGNDSPSGKSSTNINEKEEKALKEKSKQKQPIGAIVPLAIPIAVGPGAIAACIIHAQKFEGFAHKLILSGTCISLALMSFVFLYFASFFSKMLGENGIQVITRLMGMVLLAIGISMMSDGVVHLVQTSLHSFK